MGVNMKLINFLILVILLSSSALAIWTTDKDGNPVPDYSPEELVYIHGTGFSGVVTVTVIRPDLHVDVGYVYTITNSFVYIYALDGITGTYSVFASDNTHTEQTTFTDAAIWSTKDDCGDQTQDSNIYNIGEMVFINGDGFDPGVYSWEIKGKPGGASCDPNAVVASGNQTVNATGMFCINAYTIPSGDCGEYTIKFDVKGDNYRVLGNTCNNNNQCGQKSSTLVCSLNNIQNLTITPLCSNNNCTANVSSTFVRSCGNQSSQLVCIGNNLTNITITPQCANGDCLNSTTINVTKVCTTGCNNSACNPVCGNTILETNEQCDDGNTNNNDGCSATCRLETCGDGVKQNNESCDDGNTNNNDGCSATCRLETCGDGVKQNNESCDDGNTLNNDGCSSTCTLESCGDGIKQASEGCDDGNNENNDGCSATCTSEYCGDGIVQTGEQCDDGNNKNDDGCNLYCMDEYCGDGVVQPGEQCDDGNDANNDGCSSECVSECIDSDHDHVCDNHDDCLNSKPNEPIDQNGCDPFQFCGKLMCGCEQLDFKHNEPGVDPHDCVTVILDKEGKDYPRCVPLSCLD